MGNRGGVSNGVPCVQTKEEIRAWAGRSFDSQTRSLVRFAASADALGGYRHEHAAAAGMKRGHRIELGPDFERIEGLARGARQSRILACDPGSDPPTSEVRVHRGPAGEHIEPFDKQSEFAEPIRLRFRRVRRRNSVEALPPSGKDVGRVKGRLPAVEVGPREIASAGCGRSLFNQPMRRYGRHAAMASLIVGKLAEDSSTVSPFRSTMCHRQSDAREVEKARTFTACDGRWQRATMRPVAPRC